MLSEAITENRERIDKVNSRLRRLLQQLQDLAGDSRKSVRGRLRDIAEVIDEGD